MKTGQLFSTFMKSKGYDTVFPSLPKLFLLHSSKLSMNTLDPQIGYIMILSGCIRKCSSKRGFTTCMQLFQKVIGKIFSNLVYSSVPSSVKKTSREIFRDLVRLSSNILLQEVLLFANLLNHENL